MSKIGILSMQDVYNFGSLLQAYGLKKTIMTLCPSARESVCEIIKRERERTLDYLGSNLSF